jgi:D-sedoheptulose 7-phosphate isomerase
MDYLQNLVDRYPSLASIKENINKSYEILKKTYETGGKLLLSGNGGSASDCEHIVGELMKGFVKKRNLPSEYIAKLEKINSEFSDYLCNRLQRGLPAIALTCHSSLSSACINDIDGNIVYAQQVFGYGNPGDTFLGISTSGNSKNIVYASITAQAKNLNTIALTGGTGGELAKYSDVSIIVPEIETYKIQELHLPIYHTLCLMLEDYFFS